MAVNKNGSVYTPKQTRQAEDAIGWQIKAAHRALMLDDRSVFGVRVVYCSRTHQRRDIDNMTKLLFDACTGVVWQDDSQVMELMAHYFRGQHSAETHLVIYELGADPFKNWRNCALCNKEFRTYPSWELRRFCSQACMGLASRSGFEVPCANCGERIWRSAHRFQSNQKEFFCSMACKSEKLTMALTCRQCGREFRRPQSLVNDVRTYCSRACQIAASRAAGVRAPKGTCGDCGAPTSKKAYARCRGCQLEARTAH